MLFVTVKMYLFHCLHIFSDFIKDTEHFIRSLNNLPDNITFMWNADFAKIIPTHQAICADKTKNSWDHLITG
ncbi:Uncharacterised protein [Shigella sonnei]|nr:Uncharacterised protein [Shigella sonnei]SVX64409.1 Uncharacterised protein [Klebsiella pneumoniae]SWI19362.1 Uncharacterised protein [Klebsiella pneumoniae]